MDAQFTACAEADARCRYACPVAIFGRISARQRLRRAAQESLAIPAFSSPIDCTPWVIGGLWPAELSTVTPETTTLADHLRDDLQRIARVANDELRTIRRAGMSDPVRQAEEARLIARARGHAERRVESALRHLHTMPAEAPAALSAPAAPDSAGTDIDKTQVIPAIRDLEPPGGAANPEAPIVNDEPEVPESTALLAASVFDGDEPEPPAAPAPDPVLEIPPVIPAAAPPPEPEPQSESEPEPQSAAPFYASPAPTVDIESDSERLERLLAFVVRQEPTLNWAVAAYADGRTVLVTDLAHGWIPAGIALPTGVQLLVPERRTGKVSALLGDAARVVTYAPGDSLDWPAEFTEIRSSVRPRELPPVDDLGWELGQATHWRDGLPRMVHTLARAAAAGTGIVNDEVDLLRVHLDTAHHQLLAQYPNVNPALLLNCQLLAATAGIVAGDPTTANYHLSWFHKLSAPPVSRWEARS
jgi:Family of unknown function (DUF5631)/Family of unknown function (DUF5632)